MQGTRFNSFFTTALLLSGAICAFRYSPWQEAQKRGGGAAKRQTVAESGYYTDDIKQGRYASRNGILALADAKAIPSVEVRPEIRHRIADIAQKLERETVQKMQGALRVWSKQGGYTNGKSPDFLFSAGSPANEVMILKARAERDAYDLLSGEELAQWDRHSPAHLSKLSALQEAQ